MSAEKPDLVLCVTRLLPAAYGEHHGTKSWH